jgi:hypothetical protein
MATLMHTAIDEATIREFGTGLRGVLIVRAMRAMMRPGGSGMG